MKQALRDTVRGHFLMLSEKVKHAERSGWTASRPDRIDPAWVGWDAREEGKTQLWEKNNKCSFA